MANLLARRRSSDEGPAGAVLERSSWAGLDWMGQALSLFHSFGASTVPARDFPEMIQQVHRETNVVSAAVVFRMTLISQSRFAFRNVVRQSANYRQLFGGQELEILEYPDPGAMTRSNWGAVSEMHESYAGSSYTVNRGGYLEVLRPDNVDVVIAGVDDPMAVMTRRAGRKIGYVHYPLGRERPDVTEPFALNEVAHWYPEPHPLMWWTGASWVTSVLAEVSTDKAAQRYLQSFFEKGATPNMIVKPHERMTPDDLERYAEIFAKKYAGASNAFKTLWLGGGADVQVVGTNVKDMDLSAVQGNGETRIAARSRVHPAILGVNSGLQGAALNAGNYTAARRIVADTWFTPWMQDRCQAVEVMLGRPRAGAELWYDPADVLFLQEDAKDAAEITQIQANALQALDAAGYAADAAVAFVRDGNLSALVGNHDGNQSVQRLPTADRSARPAPADQLALPLGSTDG